VTVELSIQGLLRKYAQYLQTLLYIPLNGFKIFVKDAFKEAIENQVLRKLTNENYENLLWDTTSYEAVRMRMENFDIKNPGDDSPIEMHWRDTSSGVFNLLSFPTPIWLDNLNQRNRDLRERAFIIKYQ
jgi:hypothetical protein